MLLSLVNLDKFNLKLIIFIFFLKLFYFIKFCLLLIIIIIFYFTKFSLQIKPNKKLHCTCKNNFGGPTVSSVLKLVTNSSRFKNFGPKYKIGKCLRPVMSISILVMNNVNYIQGVT